MLFSAEISGTGYQGQFLFGSGFTGEGSSNPIFDFNYPIMTSTGGAIFRSTTDQVVQLGGTVTLADGGSIDSRNDANNANKSLEILATTLFFNATTIKAPGNVATVSCPSGVTAGTVVVVAGLVTHC
jgi:hypothetical protein